MPVSSIAISPTSPPISFSRRHVRRTPPYADLKLDLQQLARRKRLKARQSEGTLIPIKQQTRPPWRCRLVPDLGGVTTPYGMISILSYRFETYRRPGAGSGIGRGETGNIHCVRVRDTRTCDKMIKIHRKIDVCKPLQSLLHLNVERASWRRRSSRYCRSPPEQTQ